MTKTLEIKAKGKGKRKGRTKITGKKEINNRKVLILLRIGVVAFTLVYFGACLTSVIFLGKSATDIDENDICEKGKPHILYCATVAFNVLTSAIIPFALIFAVFATSNDPISFVAMLQMD